MSDEGPSRIESLRRYVILTAAVVIVLLIIGLGVNAIWGPKFKRDSFCQLAVIGQPVDLKSMTARARSSDRIPVITIENPGGGGLRQLEPPSAGDPDLPAKLTGHIRVNFGTAGEPVSCLVRFKEGIIATVRTDED